MSDMDERFEAMEMDLKEIKATLEFVKDTIVKADDTIQKVAADVMPTITELTKSPLLKMLGMKK